MFCKSHISFHHNPLQNNEIYRKKLSEGAIYSTFLLGIVFLNLSQFALRFFHLLNPNVAQVYEYAYQLETLGIQTPET